MNKEQFNNTNQTEFDKGSESNFVKEPNPSRPGVLERDYRQFGNDENDRRRIETAAHLMVQNGVTSELDFILETYPHLFQNLAEADEKVQALIEEFRNSPRALSRALHKLYPQATYETLYRSLKQSPIRPFVGDVITYPHRFPLSGIGIASKTPMLGDIDLSDIRESYYIEEGLQEYSLDSEKFMTDLERRVLDDPDGTNKEVWQNVFDFYQEVDTLEFPNLVPQLFDKFGNPRKDRMGREVSFPAPHQKIAVVKASQEGSFAVFDGTGSGKTVIGIGVAEYTEAKRVLVVCPNNVKRSWRDKIGEYYKEKQRVLGLSSNNSHKFINDPSPDARYVIANYELLIARENGNGEKELLSALGKSLRDGEFDLLIVDEGHYINNNNKRSDAILDLAKSIKRKLILTATPVRNDPDDLSRTVHILEPETFQTPDALSWFGYALGQQLVDTLSSKTIRRRTEDILGLPPFCPENEGDIKFDSLELNPTQRAVYDAIFEDQSKDMLAKIMLLRQASIDHNLLMGKKNKISLTEKEGLRMLDKAYRRWKRLTSGGVQVHFDSNFLVTHGYKYLFLGGHFSYKKGMNEFVDKFGSDEIKKEWEGVVESTKFQKLRDLVASRLTKGEKVVVFSGHFVKGVLRELVDDVTGEKITNDLYSYLCREFPDLEIARIDGEVPAEESKKKISKREQERRKWQFDKNCKILLTNVATSSLGIDLTVNDGETKGVTIVGIDLPYTWADFWQMVSRVYRFGQLKPVNVFILEAEDSIDVGVRKLIYRKKEIADQMLDGILPNEAERQILDRKKSGNALKEYIESPKLKLVKMLNGMRGNGEVENAKYLNDKLEGKTVGELLAELYSKYWEYSYPGHTVRLVRQILDGLQKEFSLGFSTTADIGSGPLTLKRIIDQESENSERMKVISVDLNGHVLEQGIKELEAYGNTIDRNSVLVGTMSNTGIRDMTCDAAVCSLAFDCSKSAEERGRIITEANRILKNGGYYILTFPDQYLTKEEYVKFCQAIGKFGFSIEKHLSGMVKAIDHKEYPFSVWTVVAKKTAALQSHEISMDEFAFTFETPKISRYRNEDENGDRSQYQESLIKHEQFVLLNIDNEMQGAESIDAILQRLGLGIREENLRQMGWAVERKPKGKKVEIIITNKIEKR